MSDHCVECGALNFNLRNEVCRRCERELNTKHRPLEVQPIKVQKIEVEKVKFDPLPSIKPRWRIA